MFAYCNNNPAVYSDHQGYCLCKAILPKSNLEYSTICPDCGSAGGGAGIAILIPELLEYVKEACIASVSFCVSYVYRQYTRSIKISNPDLLPSSYPVTHHIIPHGKFSTRSKLVSDQLEKAQRIMEQAGVFPVSDPFNQVTVSTLYHVSLHTDQYILMVTAPIIALGDNPSKEEIYAELHTLRWIITACDPHACGY